MLYHTTKAELFNLSRRNNNGPGEAEDVQHGSDRSLDSDDKKTFLPPHNGFNGNEQGVPCTEHLRGLVHRTDM